MAPIFLKRGRKTIGEANNSSTENRENSSPKITLPNNTEKKKETDQNLNRKKEPIRMQNVVNKRRQDELQNNLKIIGNWF